MRMRWILGATAVVLGIFGAAWGQGRQIYDQSYRGKDDLDFLQVQRLGEKSTDAQESLSAQVKKADVIFIGAADSLIQEEDPAGGIMPWQSGDVRVTQVIKGTLDAKELPLKWRASATGIADKPSEHLFLLVKDKGQWTVTRACFLFPESDYAKMRIYGTEDTDRDLGLLAIRAMADDKADIKGLRSELMKSYQSTTWMSWTTAVRLACDLDWKYSADVLEKAAAPDARRFDLDVYLMAVDNLATRGGKEGLQAILAGIPALKAHEADARIAESEAFWEIGQHGGKDAVGLLVGFVNEHPEYAVSAANTLADIGGDAAKAVVQGWRDNPDIAGQMEKSSSAMQVEEKKFSDLLDRALERMEPKKKDEKKGA